MNRRQLLKLLALGVAGHTLDIDRLLWVPNTKKIFLPTTSTISSPSLALIMELEKARLAPKIQQLFERDDVFYQAIKRNCPTVSTREIRVPLTIENIDWGK